MNRPVGVCVLVLAGASLGCAEAAPPEVPVVHEAPREPTGSVPATEPAPTVSCETDEGSASADAARAAVSAGQGAVRECLADADETAVELYFSSRPDAQLDDGRQLTSQYSLGARPSAEAAGCLDGATRSMLDAMATDWAADEAITVHCTLTLP